MMTLCVDKKLLAIAGASLLVFLAWRADAGTTTPPPDQEIAMIGGERVTFARLPAQASADLTELDSHRAQELRQIELQYERSRQEMLESRVGDYIDARVLAKEAQARDTSTDQLLNEIRRPEVTEAEVRAYYNQHSRELNQPFERVEAPLHVQLMRAAAEQAKRAYLDGLRAKYAALVTFEPLRQQVAATGPALGRADAPITIVEFSDFQCPFCRQMTPLLKQVFKQYPGQLRLVYRHMPLKQIHPDALHAAEAGVCANEQGKFWEMHDALFADQTALSVDALKRTAASLRLNTRDFTQCMSSEKTDATINADYDAGVDAGVGGTPGLFVNGRFLGGAVPYELLSALIDDELRRHASATAQALSDPQQKRRVARVSPERAQ